MYQMARAKGVASSLSREAPTCLAALVVAEVFYKFHSFTLECVAFLATWLAFSWLFGRVETWFQQWNRSRRHD